MLNGGLSLALGSHARLISLLLTANRLCLVLVRENPLFYPQSIANEVENSMLIGRALTAAKLSRRSSAAVKVLLIWTFSPQCSFFG